MRIIIILSLFSSLHPTWAALSSSTGLITGRAPTASGEVEIILPDGVTTLIDNASVLSFYKPEDFSVSANNMTANDVDGDVPLSTEIKSGDLTWTWETENGTPLTSAQIAQPFSQNFADGDILKVSVEGLVESTSGSGIPRTGKDEFNSLIYRIKLPVPILRVNGANFAFDSGFPKTGFKGATFQFYMGGENALLNSNYTFSSNQSWVSVSNTAGSEGTVTFTDVPTSTNKTAIITITSVTGIEKKFTFSLDYWFENTGSTLVNSRVVSDICKNLGAGYDIAEYRKLTNATYHAMTAQRKPGDGLWPEWGNIRSLNSTWGFGNHWSKEAYSVDQQYVSNLSNGYLYSMSYINSTNMQPTLLPGACVKAL